MPETSPREVVLAVAGELDLATVPDLEAACATLLLERHRVLLDLSGLNFVDCTGLHALLAILATPPEGIVRLQATSPALDRTVELVVFSACCSPSPGALTHGTPRTAPRR